MATLVCESGADKRKAFALRAEATSFGRGTKADVRFSDPFASGRHFEILLENGQWRINDLGSSNGLEVNDKKTPSVYLRHGDIIRAGSTYFRFVSKDETEEEVKHDDLPVISGYEVIERIGMGGMGEVFRARQKSLDREVALKVLSKKHSRDREFVEKFFREARSAGNLNHQNIVQVHDVGEENGLCYICMEYVGGGNLSDMLVNDEQMPAEKAIPVIRDIAAGLEYARSKDLVHCDIKPDNIMFNSEGVAKIADLGIACSASTSQESRKEVFGSPHFMAPEQAMGKPLDHRADLYSLGCTMYRMLAGCTPFSGATAREVMKKQVVMEPDDIKKKAPDCPEELRSIVRSLMSKDPAQRPQTAQEVLALLEQVGKPRKKTVRRSTRSVKPISPRLSETSGSRRSIREQQSTGDSQWVFKLIIVVVSLIAGYFVINFVISSVEDPAIRALDDSQIKEKVNDLNGALDILKMYGKTDDPKLAERVKKRIAYLEQALARKDIETKFDRMWNDYLDLRESKPGSKELFKRLNEIAVIFKGDKKIMAILDNEKFRVAQNE